MSNIDQPDGEGGLKRGRGPQDCLEDSDEEDFVPFTQSFTPPPVKKSRPKKSSKDGKAGKPSATKRASKKGSSRTNVEKGKAVLPGKQCVI